MSRAAKSVPRSAVVWTAAEEGDMSAGRWRPEGRTVLLVQPSAGRHGEHRPACLHLKQVDAPATGRSGARGSSPRRMAWRIRAQIFPRTPGRDGRLESGPILLRRPRSERLDVISLPLTGQSGLRETMRGRQSEDKSRFMKRRRRSLLDRLPALLKSCYLAAAARSCQQPAGRLPGRGPGPPLCCRGRTSRRPPDGCATDQQGAGWAGSN
jgi:hypothetical protein